MADETTETTTDTAPTVTPVEPSGVLDLRPPKESVRAELCRLGLEFSSADGTAESWRDYQRGVLVCVCSIEVRPMRHNFPVRKSGRN